MGARSTEDHLEEVLIASRATEDDIEAGLLNNNERTMGSQGVSGSQPLQPVKRNVSVSGLGQRLRESFKGPSETPVPVRAPLTNHPSPPKSAMKKSAGTTVCCQDAAQTCRGCFACLREQNLHHPCLLHGTNALTFCLILNAGFQLVAPSSPAGSATGGPSEEWRGQFNPCRY